MTTYQVLGAFTVVSGGTRLALGGVRQQAVLARLIVARGHVVPADRIADDLWPGTEPARSLAGLQAYISHLRRILEPGRAPRTPAKVLVTAPPGYLLRADAEDVDAWRFEAAVARAGELLADGAPEAARNALALADGLWRGAPYGAFTDRPFAASEAARLEEIRATATERGADAAIRLGGAAEAVFALQGHVAEHPLREEAWRLLALALYREGRQGDALAALARARATLAEELGVDPGPALRRLETDILVQAPHLEGPARGRLDVTTSERDPSEPVPPGDAGVVSSADAVPGRTAAPDPLAGLPRGRRAAFDGATGESDGPARSGSGVPGGGPFVGRAAELARVLAAADAVAAGRFGVVLVSGDPGAGKTTLADAVRRRLSALGWTTVIGRCPETDGVPAGWPWAQAVRALLDRTPGRPRPEALATLLGDAPATTAVPHPAATAHTGTEDTGTAHTGTGHTASRDGVSSVPPAAPVASAGAATSAGLAVPSAPGGSAAPASAAPGGHGVATFAAARFRGHQAVGDLLDGTAAHAPVLIVLDDLHRADEETLALLAHLPRHRPETPVLLLGTYRHTEDGDAFADARAAIAAHTLDRIPLTGLAATDVAALVRAICARPVDRDTISAIADRTGGNPLFVRETARLLEAEGELIAVSDVPAGVGDVLRRRLARLPGTARDVLHAAAVLGREAEVDLLEDVAAAVFGHGEETVTDAVEAALLNGLVTEPAPGVVMFTHALVRDTLYADLSRIRRGRVHERAGEAVERLRPRAVAAAAHHFTQAPGARAAARAVHWCRLAAEDAQRRFAHTEAARLWRQALDAHARTAVPDPPAHVDLLIRRTRALAFTGDLETARELRREALRAADRLGDTDLLVRAIVSFDVPMLWSNRRYDTIDFEVLSATRRVLAQRPDADDPARCRLLITFSRELEHVEGDEGARVADEALAMARRIGDPELLAGALNVAAVHTYALPGGECLAVRWHIGEELIALGTEHNLPGFTVVGHVTCAQVAAGRGELRVADGHIVSAQELARRNDLPLLEVIAGWYHAMRLVAVGRFEEAEAGYRAAASGVAGSRQFDNERALHYAALLCLRIQQDRLPEMAETARRISDDFPVTIAAEAYALVLTACGRAAEARAVAGAEPGPIHKDYLREIGLGVRGLLGLALDDEARIIDAYEGLLDHDDELIGGVTAAVVLYPVARLLGDLATRLGRPARHHYAKALEVAVRAGSPVWAAQARAGLEAARAAGASDGRSGGRGPVGGRADGS